MEARTTYGRCTSWNDLREPHGNRDGCDLHRRTVGGWIGRTVRSVDVVRIEGREGIIVSDGGAVSRSGFNFSDR